MPLGVTVSRSYLDGRLTMMAQYFRALKEVHTSADAWYSQQNTQPLLDMGYTQDELNELGGFIRVMGEVIAASEQGGTIADYDATLLTRVMNAMYGPGGNVGYGTNVPPMVPPPA